MVVGQLGQHLGQGVDGIGDRSAKRAGVQVAVGAGDAKLAVGDAAQAVGDGRHSGGELAAVADDHAIAREPVGVFFEEFLQRHAADLLFALDQELEVQRQAAFDGDPGLDALQVREQLALVVGGAAGVEFAVAAGGLERGRRPFLQRLDRLHVVMAVDQGGRGAGNRRAIRRTPSDGPPSG